MESVTITVDLEDLVANPQTLYFSESSHLNLIPDRNAAGRGEEDRSKSIGPPSGEIYIEDRPKSYFGCLRWYPEMRLRRDD